jgi:hypothetical protein
VNASGALFVKITVQTAMHGIISLLVIPIAVPTVGEKTGWQAFVTSSAIFVLALRSGMAKTKY